jgi:beta-keto acid cleavage enzyme
MMRKVWIEAALNGPWTKTRQPGIPDTIEAIVAEGTACARAGETGLSFLVLNDSSRPQRHFVPPGRDRGPPPSRCASLIGKTVGRVRLSNWE